jgi:hypothetical protein
MKKPVVLDANLTILLVVGLTDPAYISRHKRLQEYDIASLNLLKGIIAASGGVMVTPNTLTEASNILRYVAEPAKSLIGRTFENFIQRAEETYITSAGAASREQFLSLGLADCALLEIAKNDVAILSVDLDLCIAAEIAGYSVVNFNHVRDAHYSQRE